MPLPSASSLSSFIRAQGTGQCIRPRDVTGDGDTEGNGDMVAVWGTEVLPQRSLWEASPAANTQTTLSAIRSDLLGGPAWSQGLDLVIFTGPFQCGVL